MKYLGILFIGVLSLFACKIKEEKKIPPLKDESIHSEGNMTEFLKKLDVTVKGSPIIRSFQRSGKGKLVVIRFTDVFAANNIHLRIEVLIDSSSRFIFPISYGGRKKGYKTPSRLYKEGNYFSLPVDGGFSFDRHCQINFIIDPILENPIPKGNGKGVFENIEIVWKQ